VPGFPIRTSSDQRLVGSSPRLIAASYVLHRLLAPRHPPCALSNLATGKDARARYVVLKVPGPGPDRPPTRSAGRFGGQTEHTPPPIRSEDRARRREVRAEGTTLPQNSTVCATGPPTAPPFQQPTVRPWEVLGGGRRTDRIASDRLRSYQTVSGSGHIGDARGERRGCAP
jgi:hypothetical protein